MDSAPFFYGSFAYIYYFFGETAVDEFVNGHYNKNKSFKEGFLC